LEILSRGLKGGALTGAPALAGWQHLRIIAEVGREKDSNVEDKKLIRRTTEYKMWMCVAPSKDTLRGLLDVMRQSRPLGELDRRSWGSESNGSRQQPQDQIWQIAKKYFLEERQRSEPLGDEVVVDGVLDKIATYQQEQNDQVSELMRFWQKAEDERWKAVEERDTTKQALEKANQAAKHKEIELRKVENELRHVTERKDSFIVENQGLQEALKSAKEEARAALDEAKLHQQDAEKLREEKDKAEEAAEKARAEAEAKVKENDWYWEKQRLGGTGMWATDKARKKQEENMDLLLAKLIQSADRPDLFKEDRVGQKEQVQQDTGKLIDSMCKHFEDLIREKTDARLPMQTLTRECTRLALNMMKKDKVEKCGASKLQAGLECVMGLARWCERNHQEASFSARGAGENSLGNLRSACAFAIVGLGAGTDLQDKRRRKRAIHLGAIGMLERFRELEKKDKPEPMYQWQVELALEFLQVGEWDPIDSEAVDSEDPSASRSRARTASSSSGSSPQSGVLRLGT